ncbi:TetR/AcrR family transcriptional regulator C-terminal domain-containing protein [Kitasatospora sp. DSM 101779]|uniref:TetR/AcrR family transcriptional regulator C-terminal domain-containing protein n=1 Tax=Kitasatospora sp. DSM 101779 TaxID=2853165 RepID=UPI0021DA672A|nr:TetR/AcrR family transcriptional regulator C-terminal domain-containing protein [Kitasatospora sp. DSM 101779]MCU7823910.1 TetR/AcrR family transcriptional regulator C-terminal domain-containing protein [Kitasatospora sp. DSM 101779]
MSRQTDGGRRTPLNRDRVLRTAVALADRAGIEALSMRSLAQELGVVPMALYKHVANKEQLLDGMVDVIVGEIGAPAEGAGWKDAVRERILATRRALLRHPWASRVVESRPGPTPGTLGYLDSVIGTFLAGGLSADLTHHAMHALGSRVWGFTQELSAAPPPSDDPEVRAAVLREAAARYPHVVAIATAGAAHDDGSVVGGGCDDQFEFEFALDLLLDGVERLHRQGWTSARRG